jgi:lipid-A-disaccharide synthase
MMACDLALVASGTATLELAFLEKPMIVLYHTSRFGCWFFRHFSVAPWIALPNILGAGLQQREPTVIEKLFSEDPTAELAPLARELLEEGEQREQAIRRLRRLKAEVLRPGGIERAAWTLISFLEGQTGEKILAGRDNAVAPQ